MRILQLCMMLLAMAIAGSGSADTSQQPLVTGSFTQEDGRIIIFRTADPHLYYLVPERWEVVPDQVALSQAQSAGHYDLSFVMAPSYHWSDAKRAELKLTDPLAIFLDVPKAYTNVSVSVPDELAQVRSRLTPDDGLSSGELFYYRLDLTTAELDLYRKVTSAGVQVTGAVTYQFAFDSVTFQTIASVVFDFSTGQLSPSSPIQDSFVYLRCSMTSWDNLDATDELIPVFGDASSLFLDVNVTEMWMTQGGDNCTVIGTSAHGQWTQVANYSTSSPEAVIPNAVYGLQSTTSMQTFNVKFPSLGRYRVNLNRSTGKITVTAAPVTLTSAEIAEDSYMIVSKVSGKCVNLDVQTLYKDGYQDGAKIHQWDCPGKGTQWTNDYWQVRKNGDGTYRLVSEYSEKCLGRMAAGNTEAADAFQFSCEDAAATLRVIFEHTSADYQYRLRSADNGLCITVDARHDVSANGATIGLADCKELDASDQDFWLTNAR